MNTVEVNLGKRNSSIELLRIVAMVTIVSVSYTHLCIIVQRQLPTFDLDFFLSVGPIWFLISLWEIILLMNIVFRIKQDWVKSIIIIMFFTLGYYLSKENLSLPFFLTQSLIMLSFLDVYKRQDYR